MTLIELKQMLTTFRDIFDKFMSTNNHNKRNFVANHAKIRMNTALQLLDNATPITSEDATALLDKVRVHLNDIIKIAKENLSEDELSEFNISHPSKKILESPELNSPENNLSYLYELLDPQAAYTLEIKADLRMQGKKAEWTGLFTPDKNEKGENKNGVSSPSQAATLK